MRDVFIHESSTLPTAFRKSSLVNVLESGSHTEQSRPAREAAHEVELEVFILRIHGNTQRDGGLGQTCSGLDEKCVVRTRTRM